MDSRDGAVAGEVCECSRLVSLDWARLVLLQHRPLDGRWTMVESVDQLEARSHPLDAATCTAEGGNMIITHICMFLLGFVLACCLCAIFILTVTDTAPTDKELDDMYEYFKKEYGDNE